MARRRTILKRKLSSLPQELADPKRPRLGPSDPQTPMQPGLPSLPPELLLHITGQLAEDIDDSTLRANPQPVNLQHSRLARSTTLRALSQTCASLRQMCLTLAWRRVYACTTTGEGAWYQQVARALHAKSHGLMSHAYLAVHVQVLTVALTRTEAKNVLPAFVSCLSFLPSLHTLELVHVHSEMTTALSKAFEGHTFPQIRRVFLPSCAHQLLRACTHVREVLCNEDDGSKLITAIAKACKHVAYVQNIAGVHGYLKRLTKAAPALQVLALNPDSFDESLPSRLADFKSLRRLELQCSPRTATPPKRHIRCSTVTLERVRQIMKQCAKALQENRTKGPKSVALVMVEIDDVGLRSRSVEHSILETVEV